MQQAQAIRELDFHAGTGREEQAGFSVRTLFWILASSVCYYLATRIAWVLCFPDSKVSLFFPPHAVLVCVLLLVPTRQWWAFTLAAACSHYIATQQAHWPPLYALHCEIFDAVQTVLTAAGIRLFIKSPFHRITLREAIIFVLIAVIIVPFGTAFWGAAFTVSNHFGTHYWVEWRNLGISNGVTAIVLLPALLLGFHHVFTRQVKIAASRQLEAGILGACILIAGAIAFDRMPAGPGASPAFLYAPIPLLLLAALRFGLGGMSASMLVITCQAIWGTMHGRGPFLEESPAENALALQLFLLMAATPLMLLAVAIHDERRSQVALHESEERIRFAADTAGLGFWIWNPMTGHVWASENLAGILGMPPGEKITYPGFLARVIPEDRSLVETAVNQALNCISDFEFEYRVRMPQGTIRWISSHGRCQQDDAGRLHQVIGTTTDITARREAATEAELQREELAHLSRAATLSALSGSFAHELNQPLGSILSNAQAGQRFMSQDPPDLDELRAILADIVSENRRAGEIIRHLRTMLRRGEVVYQPVNVNECLGDLLHITRGGLAERGISVSCQLATGLPEATADRVQLQQVVLNLIMNACDAMESNAPENRNLTLSTCVEKDGVRISVRDRGVGLPDDVEALFQPFHSTKEGGLGMGLSICRTLISAQRGRIWGERNADRGATFHVALPSVIKSA